MKVNIFINIIPQIHYKIVNPVAESTSISIQKRIDRIGRLGLLT